MPALQKDDNKCRNKRENDNGYEIINVQEWIEKDDLLEGKTTY